jgi:hypothetical protein
MPKGPKGEIFGRLMAEATRSTKPQSWHTR